MFGMKYKIKGAPLEASGDHTLKHMNKDILNE